MLNALAVYDEVLLVLRAGDKSFAEELVELINHQNLTTLCAPDSAKGMGHSLANSIPSLTHWHGAFIMLADMPFVTGETLKLLKDTMALHYEQSPIVVPFFERERGQPVGFSSAYFDEMAKLTGDSGARSVLSQHKDKIISVELHDRGIKMDIDTPDDIESV